MELSDIRAVIAIEKAIFPVPWQAHAYQYELTQNRLASYQVLTVALGDQPARVIGYGGYWMLADEAHISTIGVEAGWQGRGLGELLLLNMLFLALDDHPRLATLEVRRSNESAQALYRKLGFDVVGQRKRYYQGREDALLMTAAPLDRAYRNFLAERKRHLFQRLATAAYGAQ
ncbi:MAG: ribosomal protein S18-alanine N-acetyltransferase [Candidatus Promineifilaceae bacterium]|nr:ribosomal protein S18-alanine N-acetyltransferase [Candidatus Promineifilaceae bacterium]